jgi:hypothetical protein
MVDTPSQMDPRTRKPISASHDQVLPLATHASVRNCHEQLSKSTRVFGMPLLGLGSGPSHMVIVCVLVPLNLSVIEPCQYTEMVIIASRQHRGLEAMLCRHCVLQQSLASDYRYNSKRK